MRILSEFSFLVDGISRLPASYWQAYYGNSSFMHSFMLQLKSSGYYIVSRYHPIYGFGNYIHKRWGLSPNMTEKMHAHMYREEENEWTNTIGLHKLKKSDQGE